MAITARMTTAYRPCARLRLKTSWPLESSELPKSTFSLHRQRRFQHAAAASTGRAAGVKAAKEAERDLFLSVLSATTTKRDAKSYISRFRPASIKNTSTNPAEASTAPWPVNVALVKVRALQDVKDVTLQGIARTLSQLNRLGLSPIVVVDCELEDNDSTRQDKQSWRDELVEQTDRMVAALQKEDSSRASRLDYVLGIKSARQDTHTALQGHQAVQVQHPDVLLGLLKRGNIPVIPPIAYTLETQKMQKVSTDDVVLALTRHFAKKENESLDDKSTKTSATSVTLDKIVLLDPLGGLPSAHRQDSSHVFINLDQEYDDVRHELMSAHALQSDIINAPNESIVKGRNFELTTSDDSVGPVSLHKDLLSAPTNRNVQNLDLLHKALALLPASASAMLTTPVEAATFSRQEQAATTDLGVITRRPRNPLIYNLLTDKGLVSSSLPAARLDIDSLSGSQFAAQPNRATFVKKGMPLTMIPDPRQHKWEPPHPSRPPLRLDDAQIDLNRLVNLIEDSFNRPLNLEHYMRRIRNNLAGIIVAGEYEGGAILTWELPPGVPDDGSESSRRRMVPYLDKFAVLKRSQGAGGVADIVFSAMVRSCFPQGVCWRSRKDNPVNKWYFERSAGTYKIPGTNWTSFWTTDGLYENKERFLDYVEVCREVKPSWADQHKKAAD